MDQELKYCLFYYVDSTSACNVSEISLDPLCSGTLLFQILFVEISKGLILH